MTEIVDNIEESEAHAPQAERLYELLSNAIIGGEIQSGVSLTEPDLARRYGVSRAPLREALRRLEERQLLERVPYRGMRVVALSDQAIADLYEIREQLEALACRRAASRIGPEEVMQIRAALESERAYIRDRLRGSRQPPNVLSLHTLIAKLSGNVQLFDLLEGAIWRLLRAEYWRRIKRPDELRRSYLEHAAIARALIDHDGDLAELLMRRHIRLTYERRR